MSGAVSTAEVASWMAAELERTTYLYQQTIVHDIASRFGKEFTHINAGGNSAISKDVLKEFNRLTGNGVVWERRTRMWRKRADYDSPGRQQT